MQEPKRRLFRISYKIIIMVILLIIISTSVIGYMSYTSYRERSMAMLSDNLINTAEAASALIDPAEYREIMKDFVPNDYHRRLTAQFTDMLNAHGIFFLHAGEIDPDKGLTGFVEAQVPGFGTGLGELTPASQYVPETFSAMANGKAYVTKPVNARDFGLDVPGGIVVGAYAPVFDENGNTIAIVSATVIDTGIYESSNAFAFRMIGIVLVTILILMWVPIIFTRLTIGIPVSKLSNATNAIVSGDLSGELNIKSRDELGLLSENFTIMQTSIRERAEIERAAHESKVAKERAEAAREAVMAGIEYASKIQSNILPIDSDMEKAFTDYSVIWKPRDVVGGDIYWMKKFESGVVLVVADCTGHGTPGALLTMLVVSLLEAAVTPNVCHDTADIIWQLEKRLVEVFSIKADECVNDKNKIQDGCDLAVLFIANDGNITLSAGHTNVYVCDGKEVKRIKGQKLYVGEGKIRSKDEIKTVHIPYNPDNKFYIASDGLSDQSGWETDEPFGYNALGEIALANHYKPLSEITDTVWAAFEEHTGDVPRLDDFELVAFKP